MSGAQKGYNLLKLKSDALNVAFLEVMRKIVHIKKQMGAEFNLCLLDLAQAQFAAGDFHTDVLDKVKTKTNVRVYITSENVAGAEVPTFHIVG